MKSATGRILLLTAVLATISIILIVGFKLNILPSLQSEMDRWVGIATVCTAVSSIVVGLVSVWIMFDQKRMQEETIRLQQNEHQPKFVINISEHPGQDENNEDSSYENMTILNVGDRAMVIDEIQVNTYITCTILENKVQGRRKQLAKGIILFIDYFWKEKQNYNSEKVYTAESDRDRRNVALVGKFYEYSRNHKIPNVMIEVSKDIVTCIKYTDTYDTPHTLYFKNTVRINEKDYKKFCATDSRFIEDFDVKTYINEIYQS